jgi:chemotaxis protein MotA
MDNLSDSMEDDEKVAANFFETIGGFSPTLGIIGTVMGLVHVLENLGGSTGVEAIGKGIAVAFIATFYGIGFANLLWLPLSNKMKFLNKCAVKKSLPCLTGASSCSDWVILSRQWR